MSDTLHQRTVNILFLEDNPEDREMFADCFDLLTKGRDQQAGWLGHQYYVECVSSIESALFSLGVRTFDILFVDYMLVGKAGARQTSQEVLQKLLTQCLKIPVVISTGFPESAIPPEYRNLLPSEQVYFLSKSDWSPKNLQNLVKRILSTPMKVLYLEDSELEVERLRRFLKRIGQYNFDLRVALTATQVREALRNERYDVLLADLDADGETSAVASEAALNDAGPTVVLFSDMDRHSPPLSNLDLEAGHGMGLLAKDDMNESTLLASILNMRNRSRERVAVGSLPDQRT